MEGLTLKIPIPTDWSPSIGHLWDCRINAFTGPTQSIFVKRNLYKENYLEIIPCYDMRYTLSSGGNTASKAEIIDVSVEVKIDLPEFSVEGGVSFTKENSHGFNEQDFFCKYNIQTSILRTRPTVLEEESFDEIVSQQTLKDLLSRDLVATHYISEIRYGGFATVNFRLRDKMSHDLLDLAGSVGGKVPVFPGISIGISASLQLGLENNTKNADISVTASSAPSPAQAPPTTLSTMFKYVEQVPAAVQSTSPTDLEEMGEGDRIKGVPISITLTPLSQLIPELSSAATYNTLEPSLLEELSRMFFHLNDLGMDGPYKFLLLQEHPTLGVFFVDADSEENPWSLKINRFEKELVEEAAKFYEHAKSVFDSYKKGEKDVEELEELLKTFTTRDFHPLQLAHFLVEHAEEGKYILNGAGAHLASLAGKPRLFIFSRTEWEFSFTEHAGPKLYLASPPGFYEIPHFTQVLYTLYSMSPALSSLGIDLRVSLPNAGITNHLFLRVQFSQTEAAVDYAEEGELLGFLEFLSKYVQLKVFGDVLNSCVFFSTFVDIFLKMGPMLSWEIPELVRNYTATQSYFGGSPIVEFCDTFLQTRKALNELETEYNFVLFPQFTGNLYNTVNLWGKFVQSLDDEEKEKCSTIVATLDNYSGELLHTPLAIVLDGEGNIFWICYDQLDYALLRRGIEEGWRSMGAMLSPNFINYSSIQETMEICSILSPFTNGLVGYNRQRKLGAWAPVPEDRSSFQSLQTVVKLCSFPPRKSLVEFIVVEGVALFKGKLSALLEDVGWSESVGFPPDLDPSEWTSLKTAVELLQKAYPETEFPQEYAYCWVLMNACDFAEKGRNAYLARIIEFYLNRYFGDNLNEIGEEINKIIGDVDGNSFSNAWLLKILNILSYVKLPLNYRRLQGAFDGITRLSDPSKYIQVLQLLSDFEPPEQEAVWCSRKFRLWSSYFVHSLSVLYSIYRFFGGVRHWLPNGGLLEALIAAEPVFQGPNINWNNSAEWGSKEEMCLAFRGLLGRNVSVPMDFMPTLLRNVEGNPELKKDLENADALFYWEREGGHFVGAWSFEEISQAFNKLFLEASTQPQLANNSRNPPKLQTHHPIENFEPSKTLTKSIKVNSKWDKFTKDGTLEIFSFQNLWSHVPAPGYAPLFLWDELHLKNLGQRLTNFLIYSLQFGDLEAALDPVKIFSIIDYVNLDERTSLEIPIVPLPEEIVEEVEEEISQAVGKSWISNLAICPVWSSSVASPHTPKDNDDDDGDGEEKTEKHAVPPSFNLSRSDVLILLLSICDERLRKFIFRRLSSYTTVAPHALPWFIPDITKETLELIDLSSNLTQNISLSPSFEFPWSPTTTLLDPPFKLLTALRIGTRFVGGIGKSSLLNEALLRTGKFSCKYELGYRNGLPNSRQGLIELSWLCKTTASYPFNDEHLASYEEGLSREPTYLANVHGNFLDILGSELVSKLRSLSGGFLVFWNVRNWKELLQLKAKLDGWIPPNKQFHFIIDPDVTIEREVEDEACLLYSTNFPQTLLKIRESIIKIYEAIEPTTVDIDKESTGNAQQLLELIEKEGFPLVRSSLYLQNAMKSEEMPEDIRKIRGELLLLFTRVLEEGEPGSIWSLQHSLESATARESERSKDVLGDVINPADPEKFPPAPFSNYEIAFQRQILASNSLSLTQLFRELWLENEVGGSDESDKIQQATTLLLLEQGFPFELWNPTFYLSGFSPILSTIQGLSISHKFVVVSILGGQGSGKSTLLNSLFGPALETESWGCSVGITARLLRLNEPKENGIDSLLILDSEGLGRPENFRDVQWSSNERVLGCCLLASADICIITEGSDVRTNSAWEDRLTEISEYFSFTNCTRNEFGVESIKLPKMLFVSESAFDEESAPNAAATAMFEGMENVRKLFANYPLESSLSGIFLQSAVEAYSSALSPPILFNSGKERGTLKQTILQHITQQKLSDWSERIPKLFQRFASPNNILFRFKSCSQLLERFRRDAHAAALKEVLDEVFLAHEIYAEKVLEETGNLQFALEYFNGLPYACPFPLNEETQDNCWCKEGGEKVLALKESPLMNELILEEVEEHMGSWRNDILSRISQEYYTSILREGVDTESDMAKELKRIVEEEEPENAKKLFKKYLADTAITFPSWMPLLFREEERVYPNIWVDNENERIPKIPKIAWNFEKFAEFGQTPPDILRIQEVLGWEDSVWMELEIEKIVRLTSLAETFGYKRGMVGRMKAEIEKLLNTRFSPRMKDYQELEYSVEFINSIHRMGLQRMKIFFQSQWDKWLENEGGILKVLEDRMGDFPHNMFVADEPEEVFKIENAQRRNHNCWTS